MQSYAVELPVHPSSSHSRIQEQLSARQTAELPQQSSSIAIDVVPITNTSENDSLQSAQSMSGQERSVPYKALSWVMGDA